MRRMCWSVSFTLLIGACLAIPGPAARADENLAGHWHLDFYGKCVNTVANRQACAALQAPATFPLMGVPGTTLIVRGVGDYYSNAAGRYTVRFVTTIVERAPHAGTPNQCDDDLVFGTVYNGVCRETGSGHGHIARGGTGMPDFWQDYTTGSWNGHPGARFVETATVDTMTPACAGTYDTVRFMALMGIKHVPVGITARVMLVHR